MYPRILAPESVISMSVGSHWKDPHSKGPLLSEQDGVKGGMVTPLPMYLMQPFSGTFSSGSTLVRP